ncbi:MAG: diadenylate cyclase CdaA [Acidobacteriota bacterium]
MSGWETLEAIREFRTGAFGWLVDVVDILLLAYIFYYLFLLIRGTRAVQMLLGVGVLMVFYMATGLAGLETVHRVLGGILFYVPFAMIVVFQNTIRRALATFGGNLTLHGLHSTQPGRIVDEVVLAARSLAQRKLGALIVLEREQGLRSYIETGIQIDAVLSYDLLVNIFIPKTPLHDGAVIIQEGRLVAASCFLPLTSHPTLSKEFGTRHRAAVGVTEETDAVTVVVSEERGEISAAFEGRIYRDLNDDELRSFLRRNLRLRAEKEADGIVRDEEVPPGGVSVIQGGGSVRTGGEKVHEG